MTIPAIDERLENIMNADTTRFEENIPEPTAGSTEEVNAEPEQTPEERFLEMARSIAYQRGWALGKARRYLMAMHKKNIKQFMKRAKEKARKGLVRMEGITE